ncbi:MAG: DNA-binding transcriptional regulator Fis [Gammaproteobacteria bacterium]|nr:DNA-binding transcriptional regulator Fis [Gammaproteobacteria bacterium]
MSKKPVNGSRIVAATKIGGGKPLRDLTEEAVRGYFTKLNGHKAADLYDLVIREVEEPLLRSVMDYTEGNQSRAAEVLGINRGTLRKKLRIYGLANRR